MKIFLPRILRNEIPSEKVYENDHVYAFNDINPQAKTHVLIIPKEIIVALVIFQKMLVQLSKPIFTNQ